MPCPEAAFNTDSREHYHTNLALGQTESVLDRDGQVVADNSLIEIRSPLLILTTKDAKSILSVYW